MAKKSLSKTDKDASLKAPHKAGLEEELLKRYSELGISLLADDKPQQLPASLRREMEDILGVDLSDVRIHTGEKAGKMAESLGAQAFTAGSADIFFAQDRFDPSTTKGKALLAHELTHVAEGHIGLKRGADRSGPAQAEAQANRMEAMVWARELAKGHAAIINQMQDPATVNTEPVRPTRDVPIKNKTGLVDKALLEQKVLAILDAQIKKNRERTAP